MYVVGSRPVFIGEISSRKEIKIQNSKLKKKRELIWVGFSIAKSDGKKNLISLDL
jgi:hypothetical protein